MDKKNIEITGVGFINKGAELMLHAIIQEFSDPKKYRLVVDFTTGPFLKRSKLGLYQKFRVTPLGYRSEKDQQIAIQNMKRDQEIYDNLFQSKLFADGFGFISPNDIDIVLDASGFRYSIQWGDFNTQRQAVIYDYWSKEGKKIFLLPQAFGPFKSDNIKKHFIKIIESVELLCARDTTSYEHIMNICPDKYQDKVKIFPDFTCLLEGKISGDYSQFKNLICIIPNYRMKDKTDSNTFNWYMDLLMKLIIYLKKKNYKYFFLVHELSSDVALIEDIKKRLKINVPVVQEDDPMKIKGVISQSSHVISSRFHGLVSALTSGVPCIGIGWSHKYRELLKDFQSEGYLIKNRASDDKVYEILDNFFQKESLEKYKSVLMERNKLYKKKTKDMWKLIKGMI